MHESLYFDPTWAKLLYEYGILGSGIYIAFFLICMRGGEPLIAIALSATYFLMGGYLGDGNVIIQLGIIHAWTGQFGIKKRLVRRGVESALYPYESLRSSS
jgi:hypothetical protein